MTSVLAEKKTTNEWSNAALSQLEYHPPINQLTEA